MVHCNAGISRSPSVIIAFLMKYKKIKLNEAFDLVRSKRKSICPNPGFWEQLKSFERELFNSSSAHLVDYETVNAKHK